MKDVMAYRTEMGSMYQGRCEEILASKPLHSLLGKVDLIFTSPPFPLNRKKKYDNLQGADYTTWLKNLAPLFKKFLKPTGSIVMEVGNSWEPGKPVMSTLALESLLAFLREGKLNLCQQFVWHNPARLPSPAQWVTIERIRLKDSFTHFWWMSPSERPKADNRRVLVEYSKSMKKLLKSQKYNSGRRPSEHHIGETSFLTNNHGAIPSSVLQMSNTQATTNYQNHCRTNKIEPHPARMPIGLAQFFIKFLTEHGDTVLDPFAGSNTTGDAAETLKRKWISIEANGDYISGSRGRFPSLIEG
jgi:site-specific DNA-methyltransferase (cytosine-N4-specific)